MDKSTFTMAEQVAQAASDFQMQRTGHAPRSVTVLLNEETLVITLREALSPAEKAMAQTPAGAYTIAYQICDKLNLLTNCDPATITVVVTQAPIDAVADAGCP